MNATDPTARLLAGHGWERDLAATLTGYGWAVVPFGQAHIAEPVQTALRRHADSYGRPSGIRWLPDLLATRGDRVALVDAKTEGRPSDNYAVELAALDVGRVLVEHLHTPAYYVWPDGGVLTPHAVDRRWSRRMDGNRAGGSGTSFVLVDKRYAARAADVFGMG